MADIFITNGIVVTMDKESRIIKNGAVAIEGNKIIAVGKTNELNEYSNSDNVIDASKKIVLPGLIDAHTHHCEIFARTMSHDKDLYDWLENIVVPMMNSMTLDDWRLANELGNLENIKMGTTYVVESYYAPKNINPDQVMCETFEQSGLRVDLARGYFEIKAFEEFLEPKDVILKKAENLIKTWHEKANDRVRIAIGPLLPWTFTPELLKETRRLADEYNKVRIHLHAAETKQDVEIIKKEWGKSTMEFLADNGIVGPDVALAHSIWMSDAEIQMLKKTQTRPIYLPTADMYLADGVPPIGKWIKSGTEIALGSDGEGSNGTQDMFETLKMAACLAKASTLDVSIIPIDKVFRMATIENAKSMGVENEVGSIEVGKKADIITVDLLTPNVVPVYNVISALIYSANGNCVEDTIIDGKIVMENREVKTLNESKIIEKVQVAAERCAEKAGIPYIGLYQ